MALFVVSYDLIKRKDYPELTKALKDLGAVRCLLSQWLVDSDTTTKGLYDTLRPHIDDDDRLMVIRFDKKPHWSIGLKGTQAWIDARF